MSSTLSPPQEHLDRGDASGLGRPWLVIVLNDNHNTFEGVAFSLSSVLPGVDYDKGMKLADSIHNTGLAVVWSGPAGAGRAVLGAAQGPRADHGAAGAGMTRLR
jgi:ATP-dependent Clp protease adaptor protein ClpS